MPDTGSWLLGVATLPALAGTIAALYGAYRGLGWLIGTVTMRIPAAKSPAAAAQYAGIAAAGRRVITILHVGRVVDISILIGPVDGETAKAVADAALGVLRVRRVIGLIDPTSPPPSSRS